VALADRTVRLVDAVTGAQLAEIHAAGSGDAVLGLVTPRADVLVVGRSNRVELVELPIRDDGFRELFLGPGERLRELTAGSGGAALLVEGPGRDGGQALYLRALTLDIDLGDATLAAPSRFALDPSSFERVQLIGTGESLGLLAVPARSAEQARTQRPSWTFLFTFSHGRRSETLQGRPEIWEIEPGWRLAGRWARGIVLAQGRTVRVLEERGSAGHWSESARFDLSHEVLSAAGHGTRLVLTMPGAVWAYDLSDATAPRPVARLAGSSQRDVVADEAVVLFSAGFDSSPSVLGLGTIDFIEGDFLQGTDGFVTTLDGVVDER
jgi:hypothetical protein